MLKAAAASFRENPAFDTEELLAQLGTGEAVVSLLDEKGVPGVAQHVWVLPPESCMGMLDDAQRDQAVKTSNLYLKYNAATDPDSAFEFLERRKQQLAQEQAAQQAQEEAKKVRLAAEKKAAKELEKEEERQRRALQRSVKSVASTTAGTLGRQLGGILGGQFGSFGKKLGSNVGASIGRNLLGTLFKR